MYELPPNLHLSALDGEMKRQLGVNALLEMVVRPAVVLDESKGARETRRGVGG